MSEFYFSKFPTTEYANVTVRDITRRVGLSKPLQDLPTVFYTYDVPAGERPDLTAYGYYGDSYFDWLIYLTNGIVDPIYDWYLSESDFESYMRDKYGSLENAHRRVKYFANDWAIDDIQISVDFYEETLPEASKKYYTAIFGEAGRIIGYRRLEADWTAVTNRIMEFQVSNSAAYSNAEIIFTWGGGEQQGKMEVRDIFPSNNTLECWHVEGNTDPGLFLAGFDSGANQAIVNVNFLVNVIPITEFAFWSPVSVYDWEVQKNENKKGIHLLEASYALQVAENLRTELQK
jgi:hypothetical protein